MSFRELAAKILAPEAFNLTADHFVRLREENQRLKKQNGFLLRELKRVRRNMRRIDRSTSK